MVFGNRIEIFSAATPPCLLQSLFFFLLPENYLPIYSQRKYFSFYRCKNKNK